MISDRSAMSDQTFDVRCPKPLPVLEMEAAPERWMNVLLFGKEGRIVLMTGTWSASASSTDCQSCSCWGNGGRQCVRRITSAWAASTFKISAESRSPMTVPTDGYFEKTFSCCSAVRTRPRTWYSGCFFVMSWRSCPPM